MLISKPAEPAQLSRYSLGSPAFKSPLSIRLSAKPAPGAVKLIKNG
jgi:hypothetical protein